MFNLERRLIYIAMLVTVTLPLVANFSLVPSRLVSSDRAYAVIEKLEPKPSDIALFWFDFGPNTKAENEPQAEVMLEHLFRKHVPVILASQYQLSDFFLTTLPERVAARLHRENPNEKWVYGEDWINVGFKPGGSIVMQSMAKSSSLSEFFGKDARGMALSQYPRFSHVGGIENVILLAQVTGLVGTADNLIQFFQKEGYRPTFVHGCTSITIPEAYIFLDSGQLSGLLEGAAGAAWYSKLLTDNNSARELDKALKTNTALGVSHLMLIFLIILGNLVGIAKRFTRGHPV